MDSIFFALLQQPIGIFPAILLLIEEAGFPIPIADWVILFTGYQISKGYISFVFAFSSLLVADLLGVSLLYYLSFHFGQKLVLKVGKYAQLDQQKLTIVEEKFKKYGPICIVIGRHIPGFRVPITVFSGMSRVSYKTFIFSTFIAVVWWIPLYLLIGQWLGPKTIQLLHQHIQYLPLLISIPFLAYLSPFILLRKKLKK